MARAAHLMPYLRRRSPLTARMAYGWLKRRLGPHAEWDNPDFRRLSGWLRETEAWSLGQLQAWQLEQLRALVAHAYENVPYYRRVMDEQGVKAGDVRSLDDLAKLPLLSRERVREHEQELLARNFDRALLTSERTGGTTGEPLRVYFDRDSNAREAAFRTRMWRWAGYSFGDRLVTLRGHVFEEAGPQASRQRWKYDSHRNELMMSARHMSVEDLERKAALLRQFRPQYIDAFPSSMEIVARHLRRRHITLPGIKAIFLESETVYPWQRRLIEDTFGCPVFAGYGHTERVVDAIECERHEGYHVNMEYGILELVDERGLPITQPGVVGRVVGTGLDTYGMPLIRYATDDLGMYAEGPCGCGRQSVVVKDFVGRVRDFIVSARGGLVSFTSVAPDLYATPGISEMRFVQAEPGLIEVQVVPAPGLPLPAIDRGLRDELRKRLDPDEFEMRITFHDRLPRSRRGKMGLLDQKLPVDLAHGGSAAPGVSGDAFEAQQRVRW